VRALVLRQPGQFSELGGGPGFAAQRQGLGTSIPSRISLPRHPKGGLDPSGERIGVESGYLVARGARRADSISQRLHKVGIAGLEGDGLRAQCFANDVLGRDRSPEELARNSGHPRALLDP